MVSLAFLVLIFFVTSPVYAQDESGGAPEIPSYITMIEGRVKVLEYCHTMADEYAMRMTPRDDAMIEWARALEARWKKLAKIYEVEEGSLQGLFGAHDKALIKNGIVLGGDPWMRKEIALCNRRIK